MDKGGVRPLEGIAPRQGQRKKMDAAHCTRCVNDVVEPLFRQSELRARLPEHGCVPRQSAMLATLPKAAYAAKRSSFNHESDVGSVGAPMDFSAARSDASSPMATTSDRVSGVR